MSIDRKSSEGVIFASTSGDAEPSWEGRHLSVGDLVQIKDKDTAQLLTSVFFKFTLEQRFRVVLVQKQGRKPHKPYAVFIRLYDPNDGPPYKKRLGDQGPIGESNLTKLSDA